MNNVSNKALTPVKTDSSNTRPSSFIKEMTNPNKYSEKINVVNVNLLCVVLTLKSKIVVRKKNIKIRKVIDFKLRSLFRSLSLSVKYLIMYGVSRVIGIEAPNDAIKIENEKSINSYLVR